MELRGQSTERKILIKNENEINVKSVLSWLRAFSVVSIRTFLIFIFFYVI